MEDVSKKNSHKVVTDCQSIAGELIANLQCNQDLGHSDSVQLHIYHGETLQEYATKLALLMQHRVEVYIRKELVDTFNEFLATIQAKYPMLFCREIAVNVV